MVRWSVVIPAYMPGDNLATTLSSVVAALAGREDFEVVVVDDASPEPIEIADYGAHVRVARYEQNLGAVPNFNRALGCATGELIHVLHADDYVEPDFYRALERGLDIDEVVAAVCCVNRVDGQGQLLETMKPELDEPGIWHEAFTRLAVSNRVPAASIVAKRSTYDLVGGFDESLSHAADWDMWIRFSAAGPIFYDPRPLAAYRVHDGQHTASVARTAANIDEAVSVIDRLPSRVDGSTANRLMTRALLYRAVYAGRTALRALRSRDVSTARVQLVAAARCCMLAGKAFVRKSAAARTG